MKFNNPDMISYSSYGSDIANIEILDTTIFKSEYGLRVDLKSVAIQEPRNLPRQVSDK